MSYSHFVKVKAGTNLQEIKAKQAEQISNNCKKVEYKDLVHLRLKEDDFRYVGINLYDSTAYYMDYAKYSIADIDGRWWCIVLQNIVSQEKLIIYTGGRLFPLYAAYEECASKKLRV